MQRFGWQRVYQGGLRVYTTIDPSMQKAAEKEVALTVQEIEAKRRTQVGKKGGLQPEDPENPLQAALVAVDPRTGEVRALVGGRDFTDSRFNRATQAHRQPGSAFKPFVYASALQAGFTPATLIDHLDDPVNTPQGQWTPEDEHSDQDSMTLRTALRTSSNRAAVRLLQEVGVKRAVDYARSVGLGQLPSVPSLALGSGEVTLLSLASGYIPFADHGIARHPIFIRKVEDRHGTVLYRSDAGPGTPVLSEATAFLMDQMLADVINAGTAYKARALGFKLPAAGKTGTTNDYNDAWFIGFTPRLLAGVWIGFDQPETILKNGFAGDVAVPLWAKFMKQATRDDAPDWFQPPSDVVGVKICRVSGKLATDACASVREVSNTGQIENKSEVYTEYFVRGTEPQELCDVHHGPSIFDRVIGLFNGGPQPAPAATGQGGLPAPKISDAGTTPDPATVSAGPQPPPKTVEQPQKKKGFWARLFGRKDKDEDKKEPEKKEPERN